MIGMIGDDVQDLSPTRQIGCDMKGLKATHRNHFDGYAKVIDLQCLLATRTASNASLLSS